MKTRSALGKMIPIIIVIGASLVISSGIATPALALPVVKKDPKGDAIYDESKGTRAPDNLADLDIRSFGMAGEMPYIQVYGKAGKSLALGDEQIYAYVVVTDDGIWAVNNHGFGHEDPEGDVGHIWHSERVFFGGPGNQCLVGADNMSEEMMVGTRVFIVDSGANEVFSAQTVELMHVAEDPVGAGCPAGSIAKIVQVFDEAAP